MSSPEGQKLPFVIGAGLGRTGTTSLHAALTQLGYKTLHMKDVARGPDVESWNEWARAKRSKDPKADELAQVLVKQIVDNGYTATTDYPACLLYKELMEAIPDAKVLLSIRSSGEAWAKSVLETIGGIGVMEYNKDPENFHKQKFLNSTYPYLWEESGVAPIGEIDITKPLDKDALIKAHDEWTERVKATVPAEKLLVHKSADGFGPICELLGIPEKDCPKEYPHLNDTKDFQKKKM